MSEPWVCPQPLILGVVKRRLELLANTPREDGPCAVVWRVHSALDAYRLGVLHSEADPIISSCAGVLWTVEFDSTIPADHFKVDFLRGQVKST